MVAAAVAVVSVVLVAAAVFSQSGVLRTNAHFWGGAAAPSTQPGKRGKRVRSCLSCQRPAQAPPTPGTAANAAARAAAPHRHRPQKHQKEPPRRSGAAKTTRHERWRGSPPAQAKNRSTRAPGGCPEPPPLHQGRSTRPTQHLGTIRTESPNARHDLQPPNPLPPLPPLTQFPTRPEPRHSPTRQQDSASSIPRRGLPSISPDPRDQRRMIICSQPIQQPYPTPACDRRVTA